MDYYYTGTPATKQFDIWYRHAGDGIIYNTTGPWSIMPQALQSLLLGGYIDQNQYDCGLIQFHYLDGDEATQRLINRFTDVYDRTSDGNIYKMLTIPGEQVGIEQYELLKTCYSHYIECAFGKSLDNIASLLNLIRETGETDEQFRARILAKIPGFIGGGTIPAIKKAVSEFLGINEDDVIVTDGYLSGGTYGNFRVSISLGVAPGIGQNWARIVQLVNEVKAAGTALDSVGIIISEVVHVNESVQFAVTTNTVQESISVSENTPADMFLHRTDITRTNSLNVVQ